MIRYLAVLGLLASLSACGDVTSAPAQGTPSSASPSAAPSRSGDDGLLLGSGLVLDDGDGPEFCLGAVAESYPPQCGGPEVEGWDWRRVAGEVSASGTTWGAYVLTGTYDGTVFTVKGPTVPTEEYDGPLPVDLHEERSLGTPCPEPAGGWRPVDPSRTDQSTFNDAVRVAHQLDGFGALWVDQSINPSDDEMDMNDPRKLVLNVRVVGDAAAAERRLREVWGGALCVSPGEHTQAELRRIQRELNDVDGMLSTGVGDDAVGLGVTYDDGSLQAALDEKYGEGVVEVHSALVPVSALGR